MRTKDGNRVQLTREWVVLSIAAAFLYVLSLGLRALKLLRFIHLDRMPAWPRGVMVVSNHPSLYEPQALLGLFAPACLFNLIKYLPLSTPDKSNYFDNPKMAWARRFLIGVPRGNPRGMIRAMGEMAQALRKKRNLILFPEGGRTAKGTRFVYSPSGRYRMREFKDGAGRLAIQTECKVIPVWVEGAEKVLPLGSRFPRLWHPVSIRVGKPMQFARIVNGNRADMKAAACAANDKIRDAMFALAEEQQIP